MHLWFYVTHDQIEAMTLATKIVVMNGGIVQQIGTPAEIYNHPSTYLLLILWVHPP